MHSGCVTVPVQSPMREHLSAPGELREAHSAVAALASCQVVADRGYWEQLVAARTHSHSAVLRATPGLHAYWD